MKIKCIFGFHQYQPLDRISGIISWGTFIPEPREISTHTQIKEKCKACHKLRIRYLEGIWSKEEIGIAPLPTPNN